MSNNIVAIVGRPNVGKSTLFNRLTQTRKAIVDDVSGTTRDRLYGKVLWNGKEFSVIDTGGWVTNSDDVFESEICKQVKIAIEEVQFQEFFKDVLDDKAKELGIHLPIVPIRNSVNKELRIDGLAPLVNKGDILINKKSLLLIPKLDA